MTSTSGNPPPRLRSTEEDHHDGDIIPVPPTHRGRNTQQDRHLLVVGSSERVADEVSTEVRVFEGIDGAFSARGGLARGVGEGGGERGRGGEVREDGGARLGTSDAGEVRSYERDNLFVVESVTGYMAVSEWEGEGKNGGRTRDRRWP